MKENSVLEEIRTVRDQHARECAYDIHKLFQMLRKEAARQLARALNKQVHSSWPCT